MNKKKSAISKQIITRFDLSSVFQPRKKIKKAEKLIHTI